VGSSATDDLQYLLIAIAAQIVSRTTKIQAPVSAPQAAVAAQPGSERSNPSTMPTVEGVRHDHGHRGRHPKYGQHGSVSAVQSTAA
jgi:hypothetical protein